MTSHSVLVVGAGPTGLTLAAEMAIAGVDVALVERRPDQQLAGSRAGGLHSRTIEMFDQRGLAGRFLTAGQTAQVNSFAWIPLDISDFPTRHPYGLALWQNHIERILAEWVAELKVPIYRGVEVVGLEQTDGGVTVTAADGATFRADYLVGCDGGRSVIRGAAGIDFPGWDASTSALIAEVEMAEEPEWGVRRDHSGVHGISRIENGPIRVLVTEPSPERRDPPTLDDLGAELVRVFGSDFGVHSPIWISRFTDAARQAAEYRRGRVLLAGDAAHIHYPVGGQGLNIGVQDAFNLGWKLARVVRGSSPESLLDSYQQERHPVAAAVLQDTLAQVALLRTDDRSEAARKVVGEMLAMDGPRKQIAGRLSGLDLRYPLEQSHPLTGRRMPDLDLRAGGDATRVYALLTNAEPLLLVFQGDAAAVGETLADVRVVRAECDSSWDLPVVGEIEAPAMALVRPDGYVAWAGGDADRDGLNAALHRWFRSTPV